MRCFWCLSFKFTLCIFWIKLWRKMVIRVLLEQFNYFLDESPVVITLQFPLSRDFFLDMRLIWALKEAGGGGGKEEKWILPSNPKPSKNYNVSAFLPSLCHRKLAFVSVVKHANLNWYLSSLLASWTSSVVMLLIETDSYHPSRVPVEASLAQGSEKDELNETRNKPTTEVKLNNKSIVN